MLDQTSELAIIIEAVNNASKQLKQVEKDLGGLNESVQKQDQVAKGASLGFGQLIAGVAGGTIVANIASKAFQKFADVIKDVSVTFFNMVVAASEVEGLGIAMHIVANNAGIMASEVDSVRDSVVEQNITTQAANRLLTDLIRNQVDYTQATELATAAQDLAVASGMDSSETIERISQAISSGNTWLLRQMGLTQHLDETYKNYASTLGKTSEELTAVERKQAVVNYVLQEGEKYVGAYDAAMGNAAKKMRSTQAKMKELSYTVGKIFNDSLYKVVDTIYVFIGSIIDFARENSGKLMAIGQSVSNWVNKVINSITTFLERNKDVIYSAVNFIIQALQGWIAMQSMLINVVQLTANVIEAFARSIVQSGKIIYNAITGNWEAVSKEGDIWLDKMKGISADFLQNSYDLGGAISNYQNASVFDLKDWWNSIDEVEGKGWEDRLQIQDESLEQMSSKQKKAYKKMLEDIEKENKKYTKAVEKKVKSFQESFDDLVISHRDAIENLTDDLIDEGKDYNKKLVDLFADYSDAMEDIEDRHRDKTESVMEDMEEERKKVEEETKKITEAYNEERTLIEKEGEARYGNLKAQLDREVALGENANQEKINALEQMIAYEESGLSDALEGKKNKHDEEISDINEKLNEKLSKLQEELDEENRLFSESVDERKIKYDEDLANAKESYEEKRIALQEELDEELAIREKFSEDFARLADIVVEDDLTRLVRKHNEELAEMERDHGEKLAEIKKKGFEQGLELADNFASGFSEGYPGVKSQLNQMENDVDRIINKANSMTFGGGMSGGTGASGSWGDSFGGLPLGQYGGVFNKPTIVGEAGAEVVLPLNFPKRMEQIMQSTGLQGGGKKEVVQNFYVTIRNEQDMDVLMERAAFALNSGGN